jgi:hypothetical protein
VLGRPATLDEGQRKVVRKELERGASVSEPARRYSTSRQTVMRARDAVRLPHEIRMILGGTFERLNDRGAPILVILLGAKAAPMRSLPVGHVGGADKRKGVAGLPSGAGSPGQIFTVEAA